MTAKLWGGKLAYCQDSDDCDTSDAGQEIIITADDGGAGKYLVIETKRWAMDNIEELVALLKDASERLGLGAK